ncbi:hypothetical protein DPEC_G00010730 [Dallia pectoralis]|uniref:Uncharacterized protein n=1 Tax=Dallia pectoralis TaxID=75939 RepID=A0ACC2HLS9_DALPE|nr:hypothetical protein DPEC_G00010730 [Dallia pectoralis]
MSPLPSHFLFRPQNGSMILYNRKKVKYRKDGYCWKKRKDGKTTREDHMKLKVQGVEVGNGRERMEVRERMGTRAYINLLPPSHTSTCHTEPNPASCPHSSVLPYAGPVPTRFTLARPGLVVQWRHPG